MLERDPWKPGGKFSYRSDLIEGPLNRQMQLVVRLVWDGLPEASRTLDEVEEKLRLLVREESERIANTAGFLDPERVFIRNAAQYCALFSPEHSRSAAKLEEMVLSALGQELQQARDEFRRHGSENDKGR